jgi:hypothetical protein
MIGREISIDKPNWLNIRKRGKRRKREDFEFSEFVGFPLPQRFTQHHPNSSSSTAPSSRSSSRVVLDRAL